jgi:hypothetical protein
MCACRSRHPSTHQIGAVHERRLNLRRRPVGCSCRSTAADPAMCGVDIEVPVKNAHPEPSPGIRWLAHARDRTENVDANRGMSGLTAKSTFVGPGCCCHTQYPCFRSDEFWNVASRTHGRSPDARSAAPSFLPIMTAGRSSSKPAVLAIAMGLQQRC